MTTFYPCPKCGRIQSTGDAPGDNFWDAAFLACNQPDCPLKVMIRDDGWRKLKIIFWLLLLVIVGYGALLFMATR